MRGVLTRSPVRNRAARRAIGAPARARQSGFSMIDLLVGLAVVGVLLAAAGLSMRTAAATYLRNGAARTSLAAIRKTQSLAITRGSVFQLQWGGAAGVGRPASQYRIVRDTTGTCSFPAVNAPVDGTNVIEGWTDLAAGYAGTSIQSVNDSGNTSRSGVMFNSIGASVNTCASVAFPVTVTIADAAGRTKTITVQNAGSAMLQ